jgi:hypothetical protein
VYHIMISAVQGREGRTVLRCDARKLTAHVYL